MLAMDTILDLHISMLIFDNYHKTQSTTDNDQ